MTNQFGDVLSGYLEFRRFGPKPPGDATGPEARVHASISLKPPIPHICSGVCLRRASRQVTLCGDREPERHELHQL